MLPQSKSRKRWNGEIYKYNLSQQETFYVDNTAPTSLAVWLLLLETNRQFELHIVDLQNENTKSLANPQGILPTWVDIDGSCLWESHAIMRYICEKHNLPDVLYPVENTNLRGRLNMALDWCRTVLAVHINQLLSPDAFLRMDHYGAPSCKLTLDKDMKVLGEFFLQETPFIGGETMCIADYSICMHLLLLYATDYVLPSKLRAYLHRCADLCEHWNEVTIALRDFCAYRYQEQLRVLPGVGDQVSDHAALWKDRLKFALEEDQKLRQEFDDQRKLDEEQWRKNMEDEKQALHDEYARRREEDAQKRREEDDKRAKENALRRKDVELDFQLRLEREKRKLEEEYQRKRAEVEAKRQEELMRKQREEQAKLQRAAEEEAARVRAAEEAEALRKQQEADAHARQAKADAEKAEEERLKKEAKAKGLVLKPQIGVEIKMLDDANSGEKDCVVVVQATVSGGPAEAAGAQGEDVITAWEGTAVRSKEAWTNFVKAARIGSTVKLTVTRAGQQVEIPVVVGSTSKPIGQRVGTVRSATKIGAGSPARSTSSSTRSTPAKKKSPAGR